MYLFGDEERVGAQKLGRFCWRHKERRIKILLTYHKGVYFHHSENPVMKEDSNPFSHIHTHTHTHTHTYVCRYINILRLQHRLNSWKLIWMLPQKRILTFVTWNQLCEILIFTCKNLLFSVWSVQDKLHPSPLHFQGFCPWTKFLSALLKPFIWNFNPLPYFLSGRIRGYLISVL